MADCEKLSACKFFEIYEKGDQRNYALMGFANMYCRGEKQGECLRRKVSKELGGPEMVPQNMMPNGFPLPGESNSAWSEEVKKVIAGKK